MAATDRRYPTSGLAAWLVLVLTAALLAGCAASPASPSLVISSNQPPLATPKASATPITAPNSGLSSPVEPTAPPEPSPAATPSPFATPAPWIAWRDFDPCSLVTAREARDVLGSPVTISGSSPARGGTSGLGCTYSTVGEGSADGPPSGLSVTLEAVEPWEGSRVPEPGPARSGRFDPLPSLGDAAVVNAQAGMAAVQQCRYLLWIIHEPIAPLDPPSALAALTRRAVSRLPACAAVTAADGTTAGGLTPLWPGFDPCSLLTANEVEAAVGTPIESGGQHGECMFIGDTPEGVIPVTLDVSGVSLWTEDPLAAPALHPMNSPHGLAIASEDPGNYWVQQGRCLLYVHGSIEPGFLTEPELLSLAVTAAGRLAALPGCH